MTSSKKIAHRLQLKDTHPTAVKLAKLFELADELGISISFFHQRVLIEDRDRDKTLPPLYAEDIEEGHWFQGFPFETEYKLVYANPEYLAQQSKEREEELQRWAEEAKLAKEKQEEVERQAREEMARQTEIAERNQLAILKRKYES